MKKHLLFFLITIFLPVLFPAPCYSIDQWDKVEISLAATAFALKAIDWQQTKYISKHPDEYHEQNPILGAHPSQSKVDVYFLTTTIIQGVIAHYLPHKARKAWLGITILISSDAVYHNKSVGIGMSF